MLLSDTAKIGAGLRALTSAEPDFAAVLETFGPLRFTHKPGGFSGLIHIILGQQVSVTSADATWRRMQEIIPDISPPAVAALEDEVFRSCGLSRQKTRYIRELATDIVSGAFDLDAVARLDDEDAIAAITRCIGLGRWTAENYLLFCEARGDLFPAKDLAILIGLQMFTGGAQRPTPIEAWTYAERWRPWRSAASLLIWHQYMGELARRRIVNT